jgi:hypothetical protein
MIESRRIAEHLVCSSDAARGRRLKDEEFRLACLKRQASLVAICSLKSDRVVKRRQPFGIASRDADVINP